ncbi:hypothetical protein P8625_08405 [Tenacibaculum tangerinum]|uniref:Tissue inhibitor of metalloproteinase n=1 Tax=Tenacibaculum tangerinum TaxID=3038772 RepID=A0ABY8KY19_9FLAO|nr:hypothetical protein [Tenacibaculum tangerinum]WGH74142.1 hypothetical protein P8625_08405 [Tenacibaculum tangerinum]
MMKKITLLFIFLVSSLSMYPCTCIETKESLKEKVKKEYISSKAIFYGKVVDIKEHKNSEEFDSGSDIISYTFEVTRVLKGNISKEKVTVKSHRSSSACGFVFSLNKKYLVYSNHYGIDSKNVSKNDLFTSLCHRTTSFKKLKRKELRLLKKFARTKKVD